MAKNSQTWLDRQRRDPFVKQAHKGGQRSRAVYKLDEISQKYGLLRQGMVVVDLGAAPGSWSEYAAKQVGRSGRVLAVDLLDMDPVDNLLFIKGDFTDEEVLRECLAQLKDRPVDLVLSDMAPNLTGIKSTDQARSMHLAECVLDFSQQVLNLHGAMLIKMFQGQGSDEYKKQLSHVFQKVVTKKPKASRDNSREFYLLGMDYINR